ncbi:MAG: hypothetical protein Q7U57_06050 [Methylovulum sp.]|nr:hypothetical protein [Methylovulum sp.]
MKANNTLLSVGAVAMLWLSHAAIADNFSTTVTIDGITRTLSFANFDEAINAANNPDQYQGLFPGVTSTVGAVVNLDFKGVPVQFEKVSATNVIVTLPSLGVTESVKVAAGSGISSSAVTQQLNTKVENILKGYSAPINKELAKVDPADPLGGNPSSIMGIMVENAYLLGTSDDWPTDSAKPSAKNSFDAGARYGHYALSGKSVDTITFPFGYTFKIDDRQRLIVSVPFTYIDTQGAQSYDGGAGFAYQYRINKQWVLTPAVAYGFRGSFDLADVGHIASGTLTSKYTFDLDALDPNTFKLTVGNMAGYYTSLPYDMDGHSVDPDLQNYIIKNGLTLGKNIGSHFLGNELYIAANFTDTEYFGSRLFVDQYNELGMSVKTVNSKNWVGGLGFNANYLFSATGKNVEGYRVGLNYQF